MSLHGEMFGGLDGGKTNENNNFTFSALQTPQVKMH